MKDVLDLMQERHSARALSRIDRVNIKQLQIFVETPTRWGRSLDLNGHELPDIGRLGQSPAHSAHNPDRASEAVMNFRNERP
jgi:hypothetical protein